MSSEVAPHYFPPSLDCSLTASPQAQISWIVSSFSRPMSIAGRAFQDAALVRPSSAHPSERVGTETVVIWESTF